MKRTYGLIGYPLSHSFSKKYFSEKFVKEGISSTTYENFAIEHISLLPSLFTENPTLVGLNVTIPYKEQVIAYLDELAEDAAEIGAVNTIKRRRSGKLYGYNSDIYGFEETLAQFVKLSEPIQALILGTGGASKAVEYVCRKNGFSVTFVSRKPTRTAISYAQLDATNMRDVDLIVNTTPLGMHPNIDQCPPIPYQYLTSKHYLLDLIYNPQTTEFLQRGIVQGCKVKNGLEMLILQAEKSWEIWNDPKS